MATSAIDASMEVEVRAEPGSERTRISVWLTDELSDVVLSGGDRLTVTIDGGAPMELAKNQFNSYTIDLDGSEVGTVSIALERANEVSALGSTVEVPPALQLTSSIDAPVSYANGQLDLMWSNPVDGAIMRFGAKPCGGFGGGVDPNWIDDTGAHTMAGSELSIDPPDADGECVRVDMERQVTGTVDPALHADSRFVAYRHDYLDVDLVP